MHDCDKDDPARRRGSESEDDFVAGPSDNDAEFRSRDHGSAIRMTGLVVLLVGFFAGMAWFLEVSQRAPASGEPAALAVVGATPPGEIDSGRHAAQAPISKPAEPEGGAVTHELPAHVAKLLSSGQQEALEPPVASGTIDLRLRHELSFGRLIVALGDRTVLSRPFTVGRNGHATVTHRLSVPSGRHAVRVEILGGGGELFAGETIIARIDPEQTMRLDVEHAAGTPHTIVLKSANDDEAGTRASH
jgi:hypothetical protein